MSNILGFPEKRIYGFADNIFVADETYISLYDNLFTLLILTEESYEYINNKSNYQHSDDYHNSFDCNGLNSFDCNGLKFFDYWFSLYDRKILKQELVDDEIFPMFPDILVDPFYETIDNFSVFDVKSHYAQRPLGFFRFLEFFPLSYLFISSEKEKDKLSQAKNYFQQKVHNLIGDTNNTRTIVIDIIINALFSKQNKDSFSSNFTIVLERIKFFFLANEIVAQYLDTGNNLKISDFRDNNKNNRENILRIFQHFNNIEFNEHEYTEKLAKILIQDMTMRNHVYGKSDFSMVKILSFFRIDHGDALDFISMTKTDSSNDNSLELTNNTAFFKNGTFLTPLETLTSREKFYHPEKTVIDYYHEKAVPEIFLIREYIKDLNTKNLDNINIYIKKLLGQIQYFIIKENGLDKFLTTILEETSEEKLALIPIEETLNNKLKHYTSFQHHPYEYELSNILFIFNYAKTLSENKSNNNQENFLNTIKRFTQDEQLTRKVCELVASIIIELITNEKESFTNHIIKISKLCADTNTNFKTLPLWAIMNMTHEINNKHEH